MIPDAQTQAKVQLWRQKAQEGTLTKEEMKEAIEYLRSTRTAAAKTAGAKKKGKAKKEVNSEALLNELEEL